MDVEQLMLTELMEEVAAQRRLWKQLDKETQSKIIAILGNLISRAIRKKTTDSTGEKK